MARRPGLTGPAADLREFLTGRGRATVRRPSLDDALRLLIYSRRCNAADNALAKAAQTPRPESRGGPRRAANSSKVQRRSAVSCRRRYPFPTRSEAARTERAPARASERAPSSTGALRFGAAFFAHLLCRFLWRDAFIVFFFLRAGSGLLLARFPLRFLRHNRPPVPYCQWRIQSAPVGDRVAPNFLHHDAEGDPHFSPLPWRDASPHAADVPSVAAGMAPPWPNRSTQPYERWEVPCPPRSA